MKLIITAAVVIAGVTAQSAPSPTVILPHATHVPSYVNTTAKTNLYRNVRYAAAPVGNNRFRAPLPPVAVPGINNGSYGPFCYQAGPVSFYNLTGQAEDCLFLDVLAPQEIKAPLPVMVWIYGGSYTYGFKDIFDGQGLLAASNNGIIYVAINYRLGAFGWMAGSSLQTDGVANAGLLDQRRALHFVQDNIAKFGGDPTRITVFGESAGGGSIEHQITAYGGERPAPFQQAIVQSPGFIPKPSRAGNQATYDDLRKTANCTDLRALRALPASQLAAASQKYVVAGGGFGPSVDGIIVLDVPGVSLLTGRFNKNITMMLGHNTNEGFIFTQPNANITTTASLDALLMTTFNDIGGAANTQLAILYPEANQIATLETPPRVLYTSAFSRANQIITDIIFTCNNNWLARASGNQSFSYHFTVAPGYHAQDIPYTFYNGLGAASLRPLLPGTPPVNRTIAVMMQQYFTAFAATGDPNGAGTSGRTKFPRYGAFGDMLEFSNDGIRVVPDENQNARCGYWQLGLFY